MIMVRVKTGPNESVVGLLVHTQLMTGRGQAPVTMGPKGEVLEGQAQTVLQAFGVVAVGEGFMVRPMSDMTPIFNPEEDLADGGEQEKAEEAAPEPRAGNGRKGKGE